jgi:hypothetical protein
LNCIHKLFNVEVYNYQNLSQQQCETADDLIVELVSQKMLTLDIVECDAFKKFVNHLNPNYKLPNRKSIKLRINDLYSRLKAKLCDKMKQFDTLSIDFDSWTSLSNTNSFITVNVHGISNEWQLFSCNLATKLIESNHTGENIEMIIREIITEFGLNDNVKFCTHDNAGNMSRASVLGGYVDIRCFNHNWDLVFKNSCKVSSIANIISKGKKIVGHFKHSNLAQNELTIAQKLHQLPELKLKQSVETRWGSTYLMLQRLKINEVSIETVFRKFNVSEDMYYTRQEWKIIDNLLPIMQLISEVYKYMSAENYTSLSLIYPTVMAFINNHLMRKEDDMSEVVEFKNEFRRGIISRFNPFNNSISKIPALISSILDPRYKKLEFVSDSIRKSAYKKLIEEMSAIRTYSDRNNELMQTESHSLDNNIPSSVSAINLILGVNLNNSNEISPKDEFNSFINSPPICDNNVLMWWKGHQKDYPTLSILSKKYLGIPATSVTSERIFSKTGWLLSKKRQLLSANIVNSVIFINSNYDKLNR